MDGLRIAIAAYWASDQACDLCVSCAILSSAERIHPLSNAQPLLGGYAPRESTPYPHSASVTLARLDASRTLVQVSPRETISHTLFVLNRTWYIKSRESNRQIPRQPTTHPTSAAPSFWQEMRRTMRNLPACLCPPRHAPFKFGSLSCTSISSAAALGGKCQ